MPFTGNSFSVSGHEVLRNAQISFKQGDQIAQRHGLLEVLTINMSQPAVCCPCRKLKREHIGGVVRPKVALELHGLRFGRHAG